MLMSKTFGERAGANFDASVVEELVDELGLGSYLSQRRNGAARCAEEEVSQDEEIQCNIKLSG